MKWVPRKVRFPSQILNQNYLFNFNSHSSQMVRVLQKKSIKKQIYKKLLKNLLESHYNARFNKISTQFTIRYLIINSFLYKKVSCM
jgi:hypothetical protein